MPDSSQEVREAVRIKPLASKLSGSSLWLAVPSGRSRSACTLLKTLISHNSNQINPPVVDGRSSPLGDGVWWGPAGHPVCALAGTTPRPT